MPVTLRIVRRDGHDVIGSLQSEDEASDAEAISVEWLKGNQIDGKPG